MKLKDFLTNESTEDINFIEEFLNKGEANEKGITEDDVDPEQLEMGIAVEYEHTSNRELSKRIALDHLAELPDYYTRLARMEEEGKKELGLEED